MYWPATDSVSVTCACTDSWFSGRNSSLASVPGVAKPFCRSSGSCAYGDAVHVAAEEQRLAPVHRVAAELGLHRDVAEVDAAEDEGVEQLAAVPR